MVRERGSASSDGNLEPGVVASRWAERLVRAPPGECV